MLRLIATMRADSTGRVTVIVPEKNLQYATNLLIQAHRKGNTVKVLPDKASNA